ncbi:MFS transporter [Bifidobacterium tissieri]|uniref:MFS transporter n=1 Tax=Bifidobacterium tissieri TaxID=1630162 RepID=A0A5M9ZRC9_9BIFI|nr:MFS transporter [Bifidobacterium tissieri]KAA8827149.1 MFS transporter [Bifidobacterium tissieri]KAA8830015.1 MFS transporter [Bifidobacterium tissieri]
MMETDKRTSSLQLIRFMIGFFVCGLLWMGPLIAGLSVLLPQRFRDEAVANPTALIAQINAVGAFVALVANLLFGAFSDRSRSRFGRRTPFMIFGSVLAGMCLFLVSTTKVTALILLFWSGVQLGLNALLAPFLAVLSDRVPESQRARMSAAYGFGMSIGSTLGTMIGAFFISNQTMGFLIVGIGLGANGLLTVLIWPKEPSAVDLPSAPFSVRSLVKSFTPPTRDCADFYKALVGRLLIMMGYYMIYSYQLYVIEDYVGKSAEDAAKLIAAFSAISMVVTMVSMLLAATISDRLGRRKPMVILCALLIVVGFIVPLVSPTVTSLYVMTIFCSLGMGIYNTCDQALNVDVLPSKDEAGKDLGILNLSNTFGQIFGPIVTSTIVGVSGGYAMAFPVAIVFLLASTVFIATIRKAR